MQLRSVQLRSEHLRSIRFTAMHLPDARTIHFALDVRHQKRSTCEWKFIVQKARTAVMYSNKNTHTGNLLQPALTPCLLALCLTTLPGSVLAETVTDRFECALGSESRSIELTFPETVNAVPCEIRETREDGQTRTLWRARFDVSFCQRQMDEHRSRLSSFGWACQSDSVNRSDSGSYSLSSRALRSWDAISSSNPSALSNNLARADSADHTNSTGALSDNSTLNNAPSTSSLASNVASPRTVSLSTANDNRAVNTQVKTQPESEVVLFEDFSTLDFRAPDKPSPPSLSDSSLNSDDIRQFDDWLIYLSAQSMASIRTILRDQESFNEYQLAENSNSNNIYSRLQSRIEFLQSLLEEQ